MNAMSRIFLNELLALFFWQLDSFSWNVLVSHAHAGENSIQFMFWLNFEPWKVQMDFGPAPLFSKFAWMPASAELFSGSLIETHFSYRFFSQWWGWSINFWIWRYKVRINSLTTERVRLAFGSADNVRISPLTTTERVRLTLGSEVGIRIRGRR